MTKEKNTDKQLKGVLQRINEQMYERNVELTIKNRTLSVQREVYEIINTTLGVNETAERLVRAITRQMKFRGGSILLYNKQDKILKAITAASARSKPSKANVPILKMLGQMSVSTEQKNNLNIKAFKTGKKCVTQDFHELVLPHIEPEEAVKIQKQLKIQTIVVYPIKFAGEVLGVMILGMNKSVQDLSRAENETLKEVMGVVGIALEQAKIYADLKTANRKLKELDKMKDDFVSVASHELRTPMTAIKSYLWMALSGRGGRITEKQKYYLMRSYNSTERLIKLVNNMLNISRIESGRISVDFAKVNILELVKEVCEEVKPRAIELKLTIEIDDASLPHSPLVVADPDKIKEVLFNLAGNSLKFTDPGGKITIHFGCDNDKIWIKVTDTGRGIADKDISSLFTKFGMVKGSYATNKKASGTGLGLYISKSVIEMHEGKIEVSSEGIGKGSTFSFSLPKFSEERLKKMKKGSKKGAVGIVHSGL